MNAPLDIAEQRAERRRQATLTNIENGLRGLALSVRDVRVSGFRRAAKSLEAMRRELEALIQKTNTLRDEFVECSEREHQNQIGDDHEQETD